MGWDGWVFGVGGEEGGAGEGCGTKQLWSGFAVGAPVATGLIRAVTSTRATQWRMSWIEWELQ